MRGLAMAAALGAALVAAPAAAGPGGGDTHRTHSTRPAPRYKLLDGTASPDGHYAIAWGVPGLSAYRWNALVAADDEALVDDLADHPEKVADYLVDVRAGRVVLTVRGFHYWNTSASKQNHMGLVAVWAPSGRRAVLLYDSKWTTRAVALVRVAGGQPAQAELKPALVRAIRSYLVRTGGAPYRRDAGDVAIALDGIKLSAAGKFTADVTVEVPKGENRFLFTGSLTVKLVEGASTASGRLRVSLVGASVQPSPSPAD